MVTSRTAPVTARWLGVAALVVALGLVYAVTLAPGLTWAHDGADGGDLIAAAASGGVAHPTGYPVYLLLARLFLKLPAGVPAWRVTLLSALSAIVAAVAVALLIQKVYGGRRWAGGVGSWLAGLALGISPLLWSQAVIAEVYALHAGLIGICLLALPWRKDESFSAPRAALVGGLLGLALGNHLTALFIGPMVAWALWGASQGRLQRLGAAALGLAVTVGVLYGLLLPWWASGNPAISWGNASTLEGWWWVVSAAPYRGLAFGAGALAFPRFGEVLGLWVAQFGAPGILVGLAALFLIDNQPAVLRLGLVWLFAICTVFAVGYNTADSYNYLVPAFLAFAVELGLGVASGLERLSQFHRGWVPLALGLELVFLFWNGLDAMALADASRDNTAEVFIGGLEQAPAKALLITSEDRDTFAAWYWHEALGERPDTVVIVERLWAFDWYHQELVALYPDLRLPELADANWQAGLQQLNHRPVCRTVLDQLQALACKAAGG